MEIVPENQNIEKVFSGTVYNIDFYQRDYKWGKENIYNLLDDIFYKFNSEYSPDLDVNPGNISNKYTWYYLNTYVVNKVEGKTYIVDGQQRLTTLTLILIKLYHLSKKFNSMHTNWLRSKICGDTPWGKDFWMGLNGKQEVLEYLFEHDCAIDDQESGKNISFKNMYQNYKFIKDFLERELDTQHKFETFSLFFLERIVLVNLDVNQTDVPMVFEVINDRGERLKPYEILKGKLLGQIDKLDVDDYNNIWETGVHKLQEYGDDQVDTFFRLLFRSKYVNTRAEYSEFDGDFHKTIFLEKWNSKIGLKRNINNVKNFIKNDFYYFINLYIKLLKETKKESSTISPYLMYNDLNEQDRQYLLIFSASNLNEINENEKINVISKLFDKFFTLLYLNGCYDSNYFTESLIILNEKIRNKSIDEIINFFNKRLLADISKKRAVEVKEYLVWNYFKEAGYNDLPIRFIRYFFARIEHFIAENTNQPCTDYYNLVRNTGPTYGYHVEHIMANNEKNKIIFDYVEELFEKERNRIGGLLLLKGKENVSSGSEAYDKKLETYVGTNIWNQTLLDDFYHSNVDFKNFMKKYNLDFKPIPVLDKNTVEERTKLLFGLAKIIWEA